MPRKSRKAAAKYSQLSRTRKRRQPLGSYTEPKAAVVQEDQEPVKPRPSASAVPRATPKPQREVGHALVDYQYVRDDLKRIGVMTAGVLLVLVVLAFVLG